MKTEEIVKKYGVDKEHLETVSRLSLLIFKKIKNIFLRLQNYDNENDLNLLKIGAILHDIGIKFEDIYNLPHNKAGATFILDNKPDEIKEEDLSVLACLIRYHRKSFPDEHHLPYKKLNQKEKAKVNYLGAIIRLADAFDSMHIDLIEDFEIKYDENVNILTFIFTKNIMLNTSLLKTIERKKDFFEAVYRTKIELKGK